MSKLFILGVTSLLLLASMNAGIDCNFEVDSCGWTNSRSGTYNFDWSWKTPAQLGAQGPSTDHTLGSPSGHYMIVTTGSNLDSAAKGHLRSDFFQRSSATCSMTFYYNMNSKNDQDTNIGTLRVLKKTDSSNSNVLLNVQGRQGAEWMQGQVNIGASRSFEIIFEVINGVQSGYVAIDDVKYFDCADQANGHSCANTPFTCVNGYRIFFDEVCDQKDDCLDGSDEADCNLKSCDCSFDDEVWGESSDCMYIQNQNDSLDWKLSNGAGLDVGDEVYNGPNSDHTSSTKSGRFAVVNLALMSDRDVARFTTCPMPPSDEVCTLRFWYFISGNDDSCTMRVILISTTGKRNIVATFIGNSAWMSRLNEWKYHSVLLNSGNTFRVQFEVEAAAAGSKNLSGFVAIDDVSFTDSCRSGKCPTSAPVTCSNKQFSCVTNGVKKCLPIEYKCDGYTDCEDGTDELACPTTTSTTQTTPNQNTGKCNELEFRCADDKCIPSLMLCDGVPDCLIGEDEVSCPGITCQVGQFLCLDGTPTCLNSGLQCNGAVDCNAYNVDESICGICPKNYCQNDGQCRIASTGTPYCNCSINFDGTRCQLDRYVSPPSSSIGMSAGTIVGIVIGSVLGVFLILVIAFFVYQRINPSRKPARLSNSNRSLNEFASTYGSSSFSASKAMELQAKSFESPDLTFDIELSDDLSTGIENPNFSMPPAPNDESFSSIFATNDAGPSIGNWNDWDNF